MLRIRCAIPKRRLDAGLAFKTSQYNVSVCCNSRLSEAPYPGQQLLGMCTRRGHNRPTAAHQDQIVRCVRAWIDCVGCSRQPNRERLNRRGRSFCDLRATVVSNTDGVVHLLAWGRDGSVVARSGMAGLGFRFRAYRRGRRITAVLNRVEANGKV